MLNKIKGMIKVHPKMMMIACRLKYGVIFNKLRKKIKGKNNTVKFGNSILKNVTLHIDGNDNVIDIDDECILIDVKIYMSGNGHLLKIGKGCRFNCGSDIWFEDVQGRLEIGESSTFQSVHFAITEPKSSIDIGSNCMFAYDIDIRTGDSHSILSNLDNRRLNYAKDIVIHNNFWVAEHVNILKGVSVSRNSIVATGSILTKSVTAENVVVAGNPAVIVKENVRWISDRIYEKNN